MLSFAMEALGKSERLSAPTTFPVSLSQHQSHAAKRNAMNHWRHGFLSRLRDDVNLSWADIPMLACSYMSGLIDSVAFNATSVFVSMQTGTCSFAATHFYLLTLLLPQETPSSLPSVPPTFHQESRLCGWALSSLSAPFG